MRGLLFVLLWVPQPAMAWRHLEQLWPAEAFPIPYQMDTQSEGCGNGDGAELCMGLVADAWAGWAAVPDVPVDAVYAGELPAGTPLLQQDGINAIQFRSDVELGTVSDTRIWTRDDSFIVEGVSYSWIDEADMVFSVVAVEEPVGCDEHDATRRLIAHEIGHVLGLGHSCEENEDCPSDELRNALMFWSSGSCEPYTPQADDIAGLQALYGEGGPQPPEGIDVFDPADCAVPEAAFTAEWMARDTWYFYNDTVIEAAGCVTAVKWSVYEGRDVVGEPAYSFDQWELPIELAGGGPWTVVLNVGGPGGTGAAKATIDNSGSGCAHDRGSASWLGMLLGLMLFRRRG